MTAALEQALRRHVGRLAGEIGERLACPGIVPGVSLSDHLSFWRAGYPGIMVTDTAFYRYPRYHAPSDTPERLNYPAMARVVSGLQGAVAALAGA
jgi:hypothetical protein